MTNNDAFSGVSNCYIFKSRLQEFAQKVGLPTPAYETTKEGPSHEPFFRSTVIVNDVRYNSLPGFSNRKAAEQSAAEVALLELSNSGDVGENISQPVHETGLCKNLLQEYAQKMNYAIPLYACQREELSGRRTLFTSTVEIGGVRYIGGAAKTKKEAEIKAARTALIAIQSSASGSSKGLLVGESQLTVLPSKKRGPEMSCASISEDAKTSPKPKKARMKKKTSKRKPPRNSFRHNQVPSPENSEPRIAEAEASTFPMGHWPVERMTYPQPGGFPENSETRIAEAEASTFPMGHWPVERMTYPQPGGFGVISCDMENSVDNFCHREVGIAPTPIVGHNQLDNADPEFLKANGSSLVIAQPSMNPTRSPLLGESSVISNGMDSSGERFYPQGVNTYQSFHSSCNTVIGNCDPPVTGMSSTEFGNSTAFITEVKDDSRVGEVSSLSGNHSTVGIV